MQNHIYRHGLMAKKSSDGRRLLYFQKHKPRPRSPYDYQKTAIYHKLPQTGCCDFNHAPYNSSLDFVDQESDEDVVFTVRTTVEHVRAAAEVCEFCQILWLGLQKYRQDWQAKCGDYNYNDSIADRINELSEEEYYTEIYDILAREVWLAVHPVDLGKIIFMLSSKENEKSLEVRLLLEPRENSTWARRRELMVLDFHTIEGMSFRITNKYVLSFFTPIRGKVDYILVSTFHIPI